MYQCFHCLAYAVFWSGDFSFEDYGYEGEGIIHECICSNCGARIIYEIPIPDIEEDEDTPALGVVEESNHDSPGV